MKRKLNPLIDSLDSHIIRARHENPSDKSVCGLFRFGKFIVRFVSRPSDTECEVYKPSCPDKCKSIADYFLDNIADYISKRAIHLDQVDVDSNTDVWNSHGFSSQSDYLQYRYG